MSTPPSAMPEQPPTLPESSAAGLTERTAGPTAPPAGAMTCPNCGAALRPGRRFCTACGTAVAAAPAARGAPESVAPSQPPGPSVPEGWKRAAPPLGLPPLPPALGHVFKFSIGGGAGAMADRALESTLGRTSEEPPLPPPGTPWGFQDQLTSITTTLVGALEQSGASGKLGLGPMLARMVRGTLLDKTIYREAAANRALQSEAWRVIALVSVLASVGSIFVLLGSLSLAGLIAIAVAALVQLVAWVVGVWLTKLVASEWLKTPVTFNQFFRALAYAQSPAALGIVPVVGSLLALWTLVTRTAAIRDVTGCDTKNAVILTAVGLIGSLIAAALVSPLVGMFI